MARVALNSRARTPGPTTALELVASFGTGQYIEPGSRWENGYIELFNGKLWDELLGRDIFYTLR